MLFSSECHDSLAIAAQGRGQCLDSNNINLMGRALPLSSYLARFITSANLSQLRTFANMISSMSEAVATGMGWAASGYSPVKTPCKVAMVLLKLVVLPLTAPSCQQINSLSTVEQLTKPPVHVACCKLHVAHCIFATQPCKEHFVQAAAGLEMYLPLKVTHVAWCMGSDKVMQIVGDTVQFTSYWAGKKLRSCT